MHYTSQHIPLTYLQPHIKPPNLSNFIWKHQQRSKRDTLYDISHSILYDIIYSFNLKTTMQPHTHIPIIVSFKPIQV